MQGFGGGSSGGIGGGSRGEWHIPEDRFADNDRLGDDVLANEQFGSKDGDL